MKQHHESIPSSSSYDELSASLQSFQSQILNCLYSISFNSKPAGSDQNYYSYAWIQKCLHLVLPNIDKAFAKFIADIDYPVTEWKTDIVDEYLQHNLSLLDHLNSISSSISHMAQACMNLLHALSLEQPSSSPIMLKPILPWCPKKKFQESKEDEERLCSGSGKHFVTHQALLIRKLVTNWVCRIVDSSIRGEVVQTCLELNKEFNGIFVSSLVTLQFGVCKEMKKKGVVKEVDEINKGVARVHAPAREGGERDETSELRKKVEVLSKELEGIKEDVNKLFSGALVRRNELLDSLALKVRKT
ncbi:hypothetical protein FRX31_006888 [Thalictrum thalictroides]|uniref:Uncharacterized protein n=1 Tax=Thalictrum thalictroides TaxID=46969 RepID=A0A7J6X3Z5_THATH|nr:hypothetical protein FRX31_006888 [Thalictrum thalictroides]